MNYLIMGQQIFVNLVRGVGYTQRLRDGRWPPHGVGVLFLAALTGGVTGEASQTTSHLYREGKEHGTASQKDGSSIGRAVYLILKFFQVDITGMFRMTSSARYFNEGVGSRRPN